MISINRLSVSDARILIKGAMEKSNEIAVPMCIAITDESGNLIAFERMDGGKIHSSTIAQDKAFTAASARKGTHEYNEACIPGADNHLFGIHTAMAGRLCIVGGGLPVVVNGEVVGGIGLSSGSPAQDMSCAQAGLNAFYSSIS